MNNNFNYSRLKPISISIIATIVTIVDALITNFGTIRVYRTSNFGGTIILIMFSLLPLFFEGYREHIWTKKGIITLLIALAINLPIGIYCTINRYNLFGSIM